MMIKRKNRLLVSSLPVWIIFLSIIHEVTAIQETIKLPIYNIQYTAAPTLSPTESGQPAADEETVSTEIVSSVFDDNVEISTNNIPDDTDEPTFMPTAEEPMTVETMLAPTSDPTIRKPTIYTAEPTTAPTESRQPTGGLPVTETVAESESSIDFDIGGDIFAEEESNKPDKNNIDTDEPTFLPTEEPTASTPSPTRRTIYITSDTVPASPAPDGSSTITTTPTFAPFEIITDPKEPSEDVDDIVISALPTYEGETKPPVTIELPDGGFVVCFPGDEVVIVKSKGKIPMKELQLGDEVYVGNGKYEEVYSFGHYDPTVTVTTYLEIHASEKNNNNNDDNKSTNNKTALRISPDHMIYSESLNTFVPSSKLNVGDQLLLMMNDDKASTVSMEIQSIKSNVEAIGAYAPFTPSGQIVVNDILASTYIALEGESPLPIPFVSHQWLAHSFEFPHRFICHYFIKSRCHEETYDKDGVSTWVSFPLRVFQQLLKMNTVWKNLILFTFVIPVFLFFTLMEYLLLLATLFFLPTLGTALLISTVMIGRTSVPITMLSIKYQKKAHVH